MHRVTSDQRHEFARQLVIIARRWRKRADERLKRVGLTQPQWAALYWLAHADTGLSQTALAERAGVEAPTLVRTLDLLERNGLVERRPHAADRRINLVYVTPAAAPLVEQIEAIGDDVRNELMGEVTFEEFESAMRVFAKILGRLDETPDLPTAASASVAA